MCLLTVIKPYTAFTKCEHGSLTPFITSVCLDLFVLSSLILFSRYKNFSIKYNNILYLRKLLQSEQKEAPSNIFQCLDNDMDLVESVCGEKPHQ